jgi:DNA gyrase subunit A
LIDGKPRTIGVKEIIQEWLKFRVECIRRAKRFDLKKAAEQLHLLEGLSKIIVDIDKAIDIIRKTDDDKRVVPNLCSGFDIDAVQANFIAEIKLRNLNKDYLLSKIKERDNLKNEISELNEIIAHDSKIYGIIISELKQISKKFGKPRKTEIIYSIEEHQPQDLIDDYDVKLFFTEHGYFKKIASSSWRATYEQYLKDDDSIKQTADATNRHEILFFTDAQNVYKARLHEISESKASSIGEYLPNFLGCADGEKVLMFALPDDYSGFMMFFYSNGKTAKIEMSAFATKTNRKKLINATSDKAELVLAEPIKQDCDFVLFRDSDKALLFNTMLIASVGAKNSPGIQVFSLKKGSTITKAVRKENAGFDEPEFYRADKIPSVGHFIT